MSLTRDRKNKSNIFDIVNFVEQGKQTNSLTHSSSMLQILLVIEDTVSEC